MGDHQLDYAARPAEVNGVSRPGFAGRCSCGDFQFWVGGDDLTVELTILDVHAWHVDNPEAGK